MVRYNAQNAEKEEIESMKKELEDVAKPIMQKLYGAEGQTGGMPGGMPDMSGMPGGMPDMSGMPGGMPDMSGMPGGMPGGMPDMSQMPDMKPTVEEVD